MTDASGDKAQGKLTAEVHDDVPVMEATLGADKDGTVLQGNVDLNFGADAMTVEGGLTVNHQPAAKNEDDSWTVKLGSGTLTLTEKGDGTYDFRFAPNDSSVTGSQELIFEVTDSDGDKQSSTVTVTWDNDPGITPDPDPGTDPDPSFPGAKGSAIVVDEGALPSGSGQHTAHGYEGSKHFSVDMHGEGGVIQVGGENGYAITVDAEGNITDFADNTNGNGIVVNGVKVTLDENCVAKGDGTSLNVEYSYQLQGNQAHGEPDSATDNVLSGKSIDIDVTDNVGNDTAHGELTVEVHDDVPVANDVSLQLVEHKEVHGNVTDNDSFGADGAFGGGKSVTWDPDALKALGAKEDGQGGYTFTTEGGSEVHLHKDGSYDIYTHDQSVDEDLSIGYTITDGDKDTAHAELEIGIQKSDEGEENIPTVQGGDDNNVIIADSDGSLTQGQKAHDYNIALVLDVSSSMDYAISDGGKSRFEAAKDALQHIFDQLGKHDGKLNVTLFSFSGAYKQELTLSSDDFKSGDWSSKVQEALNSLATHGATNYDLALQAAQQWFKSQENGYENKAFFITDGSPTMHDRGFFLGTDNKTEYHYNGLLQDGMTFTQNGVTYEVNYVEQGDFPGYFELLNKNTGKTVAYSNAYGDASLNSSNEEDWGAAENAADSLKNEKVHLHIVGIENDGLTGLERLNGMDSDGKADIVSSSGELDAALQGLIKDIVSNAPQSDAVYGGAGNDIIFGDDIDLAARMEKHGITDSAAYGEYIQQHASEFDISTDSKTLADGTELAWDKGDFLAGGSGNDILFGQGGNDLLVGDGGTDYLQGLSEVLGSSGETVNSITDLTNTLHTTLETTREPLDFLAELDGLEDDNAHGDDVLFGGEGSDVLLGGAGNDKLFGGEGEDILIGGGGNDYLDGGAGHDYLYGGEGNDLMVYDADDYAVFGGSGIDVLLSNSSEETLNDLLKGIEGKPHVQDVELFLKGDGVENLTSMDDLTKYGIHVENDQVTLDTGKGWHLQEDSSNIYTNDAGLTLETTLYDTTPQPVDDAATHAANEIVLTQQG